MITFLNTKVKSKVRAITLCALIAATSALAFAGCERAELSPTAPTAPTAPAAPAIAPARDPVHSVLAADVEKIAGNSDTLRAVRASGILVAAVECDRPPMCFKDEYGVARGFEPDLLKFIASALGVKLNIVAPEDPSAVVSAPHQAATSDNSVDYFYSAETRRLAFVVKGDSGFRNAVALAVDHLYDTGSYSRIFKSWFSYENANK